jgi:WD40 repeat protein
MTLEKKPEIMGLLAVQAYKFNLRNGGAPDDPVIFKALDKAYSVLDNSKHCVFQGSANEILSLSENQSGIISTDLDGNLIEWTYDGNYKHIELHSPQSFINFISLNPSENKMLICYENRQVVLRDQIRNNEVNTRLNGHTGNITSATWSNDGIYLATGGTDSLVLVWNILSGSGEPEKKLKGKSVVRDLIFCNADSIISAQEDGSLYLWNLKTSSGARLKEQSAEKPLCLAWDSSRGNLLAGTSSGTILFFDLNQRENDTTYASHTTGIDKIIFNKDFSLVATAAWDKEIRIYNYNEFFGLHNFIKGVISFDNPGSRTRSMIFTSDNKLAAGMADKSIRLWETSAEKLVSNICELINRDLTEAEWSGYLGTEPYEKTCGNNP